jgi:cytochrome P450
MQGCTLVAAHAEAGCPCHPALLERLRNTPELVPAAVEELLRYDGPVQFLSQRTTLDAIELAGTTIPKGVLDTLALAAGNRDPARFKVPDRFDPERRDNEPGLWQWYP